jgi:hypothetical protein
MSKFEFIANGTFPRGARRLTRYEIPSFCTPDLVP